MTQVINNTPPPPAPSGFPGNLPAGTTFLWDGRAWKTTQRIDGTTGGVYCYTEETGEERLFDDNPEVIYYPNAQLFFFPPVLA
jgi:hypothetical protein